MRLTPDLDGARVTVARAAELAGMHPAHFRRLCRRGVFPKPKRTAKNKPYFDYGMFVTIANVMKTGIGQNGEEILFYRKAAKRPRPESAQAMTPYLSDIAVVLRQLGIPEKNLSATTLKRTLKQAFGSTWPDVSVAIPELNRRLLG